ncbi:MAG: energy-coupling factor transporter transmembrane component T [Pseudotabrizicola sp.]|uniref:energy-coupling factor transporter transmembrane component T family protein n=1 Tax=Pseudotabrizicola sp. TaxID=2939647 RepID=UPI00271FD2ED|nr:energy-coupling factor transporter transmembrane component T [Pseudotabrizicola sp.]MDO9640116.1 energy-coupling factor transporter transmembrane component T [Pseudotabrizicola sp.]
MLTLTSPVDTPLHRVAAGVKLGALAVFTLVLFQLTTPLTLSLALLGIIAVYLTGGMPFARHGARMLRPLWPFVALIALWHLWRDDLTAGTAILLRMTAAVAAANLVTMTTRLSDMISVLERLARPLSPLLPPRRLALAIALVIRFIPVLSERVGQLSQAYSARSPRKPGWRLAAPAALAALDDAEQVAQALRARGGTG